VKKKRGSPAAATQPAKPVKPCATPCASGVGSGIMKPYNRLAGRAMPLTGIWEKIMADYYFYRRKVESQRRRKRAVVALRVVLVLLCAAAGFFWFRSSGHGSQQEPAILLPTATPAPTPTAAPATPEPATPETATGESAEVFAPQRLLPAVEESAWNQSTAVE